MSYVHVTIPVPLRFPATRIVPEVDHTEWLLQEMHQIAKDLELFIDRAPNVHIACQIRERVTAAVQILTAVENRALAKTREF